MTTPTLCPSQLNELGKGIFAPEEEARLLGKGYIFACHIPDTLVGAMLVCKRPIADAVTDSILNLPQYRKYSQVVPTPVPSR